MDDTDDFIIGEGKADKPIGYPPNVIIRRALEKTYVSITGALDVGDFETFLKEVADLTYDEAKEKLITQYGTPRDLSEARLRAKSAEAEAKFEEAEHRALSEQRTLEDEFGELEEVARKRLSENTELTRRNRELEAELRRTREDLEKARAAISAIPPPAVPPLVPALVPAPAVPEAHGRKYQDFKERIAKSVTVKDITRIADEVYAISLRRDTAALTPGDVEELKQLLVTAAEERTRKLAELRFRPPPEIKRPREEKAPTIPAPERAPRRRKKEEAGAGAPPGAPPQFVGVPPVQVVYRYTEPDTQTFTSMGEEFIRDFELERVLKYNGLLGFPEHWYTLSPFGKRERYGWDLGMAMREAVEHLHKFSWGSLERDFGIPRDYIEIWKMKPEE